MNKIKKIGFVFISIFLIFSFSLVVGNLVFWREQIHLPGELSIEAIAFSFHIVSLYILFCITYFISNIKIQNILLFININFFVFFLFLLLGSVINLGASDYNPHEVSTFATSIALIFTLISIPVTLLLYFKFRSKDLRSEFYIKFLEKVPMFSSIKFNSPVIEVNDLILSSSTKVNEEVKVTISNDEIRTINYDDVLKEVQNRLLQMESLGGTVDTQVKVSTPVTNNNIEKSTVNIDELLDEYNIEKKLYLKAKGYYDRSIFKKTLNPCIREDKEVLNWEEIKFINDLGLLHQEINFPYLVTIDNADESIRRAFEFEHYVKDRGIFIPDLNNLDNLNNGFEFEEYVVNFLKENSFTDIQKLSNFEKNGADILAIKDNIRYAFKCKYYSKPVGLGAVKEVIKGSNYHYARVPVVVTNSTFNKNAITHGNLYNVQLWDRLYLVENRKV